MNTVPRLPHGTVRIMEQFPLARERSELRVVADQTGGPMSAAVIADGVVTMLMQAVLQLSFPSSACPIATR